MSKAIRVDKKTIVYDGPLSSFNENIKRVDVHNKLAYLDLHCFDRLIKAGVDI